MPELQCFRLFVMGPGLPGAALLGPFCIHDTANRNKFCTSYRSIRTVDDLHASTSDFAHISASGVGGHGGGTMIVQRFSSDVALHSQLVTCRRTQVGVWQAVLGYTLASSCGLLWCIEGVVNNALHGEAHPGLLRNSKFSRYVVSE